MILNFINLLKYVWLPNIWTILYNILCEITKNGQSFKFKYIFLNFVLFVYFIDISMFGHACINACVEV